MLILRFDLESAYALRPVPETDDNWQRWIDEAVASVSQIVAVLARHNVPATFFVVGRVLEKGGDRLAAVLKSHPLVDIESHSYSHMVIKSEEDSVADQFRQELRKTSDLIETHFGTRPIGFCAPGNFHRGLRGCRKPLQVLWEEGYRFVGSDGSGPPDQPMPAPFTQPYWYADDGFPGLLEEPITGWHCNLLFNTGGQSDPWTPVPGWPDGPMLEKAPITVDEGFEVRRQEFQYAIDNGLVYAPAYHPWSIYRFDPGMAHLGKLIDMAKASGIPILNCKQLYETCSA